MGCRLWGRTELDTTKATWQQQQQRAFLVAWWLRIGLAIQGTQIQSLIGELSPIGCRATKPMSLNY